jgi:hypothetical protein
MKTTKNYDGFFTLNSAIGRSEETPLPAFTPRMFYISGHSGSGWRPERKL